jgi:RNA polymerase sigma factor (sigma-70 family)
MPIGLNLHLLYCSYIQSTQLINSYALTEADLILGCKQENKQAQKLLYDKYASLLYSVARRYMGNKEEAEDVLLTGFYKILIHIEHYQGSGSFEGWMRRIIANEALMLLRKRQVITFGEEKIDLSVSDHFDIHAELSAQEIMVLIDKLPAGYRTVFNLYVLDGLSHQEIADMLGVSINTSKSQLIMARQRLQAWITKREKP